jgi:hypothetical protein
MSAYKYYDDRLEKIEEEMTDVGKATNITMPHIMMPLVADIPTLKHSIDYKYNEGNLMKEIKSYVDATYDQHYSRNKFQSTEFIVDCGHGTGFNIGNMMKYTQRYGRKGDAAEWRKDLMKVIHYAIMQLYVHDLEHKKD